MAERGGVGGLTSRSPIISTTLLSSLVTTEAGLVAESKAGLAKSKKKKKMKKW